MNLVQFLESVPHLTAIIVAVTKFSSYLTYIWLQTGSSKRGPGGINHTQMKFCKSKKSGVCSTR